MPYIHVFAVAQGSCVSQFTYLNLVEVWFFCLSDLVFLRCVVCRISVPLNHNNKLGMFNSIIIPYIICAT